MRVKVPIVFSTLLFYAQLPYYLITGEHIPVDVAEQFIILIIDV
jgi:hypothetical protein